MPITPAQLRQVAQLCDDHGLNAINISVSYPHAFTVTVTSGLPDGCTDIVAGEWTESDGSLGARQYQPISGTIDGIRVQAVTYRDTPIEVRS